MKVTVEFEITQTRNLTLQAPTPESVFDNFLGLAFKGLTVLSKTKKPKKHYFADDPSIIQSSKSLEVLAKQLNKDPLNLSYWLRANKLCLNVQKIYNISPR